MSKVEFTTNELIGQYIKMRDMRDKLAKQHDEQKAAALKPYDDGMGLIEGVLTSQLLQLADDEGRRNISTDAGTAFRSKWQRVKVEDRAAFMEFVFNIQGEQFMTNHVSKEAVLTWMDEHNGNLPPGVGYEAGWQTVIRRR